MAVTKSASEQLERLKKNVSTAYTYFLDNYRRYRDFRRYVFKENINEQQRTVLQQLNRPVVEFNVNDAGTDWIISVHSDRLAKNLMMTWNGRAGIFSDNYFDILPGETKEIRLPKSVSPLNPLKALAVKSLADTF